MADELDPVWKALSDPTRRTILEWITLAKRPETRARRIAETVARAAAGIRAR